MGEVAKDFNVIKWKHFSRYLPFVRGISRSPVNSQHTGQWRGALICGWITIWVNNREAGDLRHHRAHYDVSVMPLSIFGKLAIHHGYCSFVWLGSIAFRNILHVCPTNKCISGMKMVEFWLKFPWSLFLRFQLTIICADNRLAPNRRQAITRTNDGLVYERIYTSHAQREIGKK